MQRYLLQDAIFSSKYKEYFIYRMRFFLPIALFTLVIRAFELFLIEEVFQPIIILNIVLMRLIVGLVLGGWWGALEVMREYIRGRHSFSDKEGIEKIISLWVFLTFIFATIVVIVTTHFFLEQRALIPSKDRFIYDLYLLGFGLNVFFDLGIDAYRSGAFAIKRIYRPLTWVIGPSVIQIALFIVLFKGIGAIGLPIAFILSQFVDTGVKIYFIKETYRSLKINPHLNLWAIGQKFRDFLINLPKNDVYLAFLAGVCLNVENLLIILFFKQLENDPLLIVYLLLLKHIYHAYSDWGVMFFYYDFKKMCSFAYPPFYKEFVKKLFPFSCVISGIFFALTIPVTYIFYPSHLLEYTVLTGMFSIIISVLSYILIHAFALNRYLDLIIGSILAIFLFVVGVLLFNSHLGNSISLLVALFILILFLLKPHFPVTDTIESIKKQSLYTLMSKLNDIKGEMFITKIKTNPKLGRKVLNRFLGKVALQMDSRGWMCPLKSNVFLLLEPVQHKKLSNASLREIEKGMVKSCRVSEALSREGYINFVFDEISKEISDNPFYKEIRLDLNQPSKKETHLAQIFKKQFPTGKMIELDHLKSLFNRSDRWEIYAVIEESYMTPLSIVRKAAYLGILFFDSIPTLFLIKKQNYKFRKLSEWNHFVHYLNFRNLKLKIKL